MKSILGTIIIFFGIYIILYFDIFGFFAQTWVFYIALGLALFMLLLAFVVLRKPLKKKGGQNDKNN